MHTPGVTDWKPVERLCFQHFIMQGRCRAWQLEALALLHQVRSRCNKIVTLSTQQCNVESSCSVTQMCNGISTRTIPSRRGMTIAERARESVLSRLMDILSQIIAVEEDLYTCVSYKFSIFPKVCSQTLLRVHWCVAYIYVSLSFILVLLCLYIRTALIWRTFVCVWLKMALLQVTEICATYKDVWNLSLKICPWCVMETKYPTVLWS